MKKAALLLVMIMASGFMFSQNVNSGKISPKSTTNTNTNVSSPKMSFLDVYNKALALNRPRFKDVNRIQIGDTVIFPSMTNNGFVYWVADAPQIHNGKHDCIWRLSERYLSNQIVTKPVTINIPEPTNQIPEKESDSSTNRAWVFSLFAVAVLVIFACLIYYLKIKSRNAENHPPMILRGIDNNDQRARTQIAALNNTPENNILDIKRGIIIRESGPKRILVQMKIGGGVNLEKEIWLNPGERICKVTISKFQGVEYQYFRSHCGNRFGTIVSEGQFEMPEGWHFEEIPSVANTQPTQPVKLEDPLHNEVAQPNKEKMPAPVGKGEMERLFNNLPKEKIDTVEIYGENINIIVTYRENE